MLTTVGSVSNLNEGKMENLEIHVAFKNIDFSQADFETQLVEGLQKVRDEIIAHRQLIAGIDGQCRPARNLADKPLTSYPQMPE